MDDSSEVFDEEDDLEIYEPAASESDLHRRDNWICPCSPLSMSAGFVMLFLFLLVCSIVLGLVLPFELGTINRGSTSYYHHSGDTRTVAYDYVFCERVAVTPGPGVVAGLYAVSRLPEAVLSDGNDSRVTLTLTDTALSPRGGVIPPGESDSWMFHLHPRSRVTVAVSVTGTAQGGNAPAASFWILKGRSEFENFSSGRAFSIFSNGSRDFNSNHTIAEEDDYYFIVANGDSAPESATFGGSIVVNKAQLSLAHQEFSCEARNSLTCSVDNFRNRWYILTIRATTYGVTDDVLVTTECVKRAVTFILIPIVPVAVFFSLTFILFIPCVGICRKEVKHIAKQRREMRENAANKGDNGKRVIFRNRHISKTGKLRYSAQKQSKHPPTIALENPIGVGSPSS